MVERWLDGYDGLKEVERVAGEFVEGTREKEVSELGGEVAPEVQAHTNYESISELVSDVQARFDKFWKVNMKALDRALKQQDEERRRYDLLASLRIVLGQMGKSEEEVEKLEDMTLDNLVEVVSELRNLDQNGKGSGQ